MFTKQSTLDPHVNQSGTPTQNFPLPTLHLLDILNLTPYQFSEHELHVLKYGLSFCPLQDLDKYEAIKDIYMFMRNLTFKFLFD